MTEQKELRGITLVSTATVTFHFLQPGRSSSFGFNTEAVGEGDEVCCVMLTLRLLHQAVGLLFFFFKFAVGFTQMMFWPPCERVLF